MKPTMVIKGLTIIAAWIACGLGMGCTHQKTIQSVDRVDLVRYAGKWYEIARFPNGPDVDCAGGTIEYTPVSDDTVRIVQRCAEPWDGTGGKTLRGTARSIDPTKNARWRVTFSPADTREYWILDVTADYQNALVGTPDRTGLWILSRTGTLDPAVQERFLSAAGGQGYDVSRLVFASPSSAVLPTTVGTPPSGAPPRAPTAP